MISDGARVRLNSDPMQAIGISYADELCYPSTLIEGGRCELKSDNIDANKISVDNADYKIDLKDDLIHKNFIQLCNDYADYCLSMLIKNEQPKAVSKIFISLILHIIKRVYQEDCSAGFSFCVSPDLFGYPCHV